MVDDYQMKGKELYRPVNSSKRFIKKSYIKITINDLLD